MGTGEIIFPDYVPDNKGLNALVRDSSRQGYTFNQDDFQTRPTGSVGGMEGGVREAWTANEPREDRSDVGWTPERGIEHQVGW